MTKYVKEWKERRLEDEQFDTYSSVDDLLEQCKRIKIKYPDKKVCLVENAYGYNSSDVEVYWAYDDVETDEELQGRIDYEEERERFYREEREREQARKKDAEEFERLKRKLGRF